MMQPGPHGQMMPMAPMQGGFPMQMPPPMFFQQGMQQFMPMGMTAPAMNLPQGDANMAPSADANDSAKAEEDNKEDKDAKIETQGSKESVPEVTGSLTWEQYHTQDGKPYYYHRLTRNEK